MSAADNLAKVRAVVIVLLAVLLLASQAAPSTLSNEAGALPIVGWVLLCSVLLVHIHPIGLWPWRKELRVGVEDEGSRHNRYQAYGAGFWTALAAGLVVYGVPSLRDLPAREAARLIVSAGIAGAAIRFALKELRDLYG